MKRFAIVLLTLSLFATAAPSAEAFWWPGKNIVKALRSHRAHKHSTSHSVTKSRTVSRSGSSCPGGVCPL